MLIVALPGGNALAEKLAQQMACDWTRLAVHRFPDGELRVTIAPRVEGRRVVLAGSLDHPDDKTLAVHFAADAARELGATRVGLVAPYLAYMRQDMRFHPGEAITSRTYARLLSSSLDFLVTVDPHLHRWHDLGEIYRIPAFNVPAAPLIAAWLRANIPHPLLVGPDAESLQWVREVARLADAPYTVLSKTRHGDREVEIDAVQSGSWAGLTPVLLDDIASTGETLVAAAQALRTAGQPPATVAVVVHALFSAGATQRMREEGIARIFSCDSIAHETNAIALGPALADSLRKVLHEQTDPVDPGSS